MSIRCHDTNEAWIQIHTQKDDQRGASLKQYITLKNAKLSSIGSNSKVECYWNLIVKMYLIVILKSVSNLYIFKKLYFLIIKKIKNIF